MRAKKVRKTQRVPFRARHAQRGTSCKEEHKEEVRNVSARHP